MNESVIGQLGQRHAPVTADALAAGEIAAAIFFICRKT
jgi:hypothetical protein